MSNKLPPHLAEAQRLLDAGLKLVKLHNNQKRPVGEAWNVSDNIARKIDPEATGYGIVLAANGLCSIDPDDVHVASIGLKALGFELEDIMALGVRTASTRPGSGGRSAFKAVEGLTWIKFSSREGGTALEFRAHSPNLQDCCPGVQYTDINGNPCEQDYDPFTQHLFDDAPDLPPALLDWWLRCSTDVEFLRQQQELFFAPLNLTAHRATSSGRSLAFSSRLRKSFNDTTTVESILERHGYTKHSRGRWAPATATGAPSVRFVQGTDNLWHSDHASDPLFGNFDAWLAYVVLDHNGDQAAAEAACPDALLDSFEVVCPDTGEVTTGFEALEADARKVTNRDELTSFAKKVSAIRPEVLNDMDRTILAGLIATNNPVEGMTKPNIKAALKYNPPRINDHVNRPQYERDDDGGIRTTTGNIVLAFKTESEIGMRFTYDSFTDGYMYSVKQADWKPIHDEHYVALQIRLEKLGIYGVTSQKVRECLQMVCRENQIDSAQMWLDSLEWDGIYRIDSFFHKYFGAEDNEYTTAVSRYIWTAMAARVIVPGHQVDMIPVLVGSQGVRKSTGIAAMAPKPEFFSEFSFGENETEVARRMIGCLVGEVSELRGIRSREKEHIKGWITRRVEEVRRLYENTVRQIPRRLVFIGTTNEEQFLDEDSSGQRRWLPIRVTQGEVEKIKADCLQLWAEGASVFRKQGDVSFEDAERLAKLIHEDFVATDIFEIPVVEYLNSLKNMAGGYPILTMNQIFTSALGIDDAKSKPSEASRVSVILKKKGWIACKHHGVRSWRFNSEFSEEKV